MNRLALNWIDVALALEEENRELRDLMGRLLLAIARNRPTLEFARAELDPRDDDHRGAS